MHWMLASLLGSDRVGGGGDVAPTMTRRMPSKWPCAKSHFRLAYSLKARFEGLRTDPDGTPWTCFQPPPSAANCFNSWTCRSNAPNLQGARAGSGLLSERAMLGARGTRGRATDQLVLELGAQMKQAMQQSCRGSLGTIGAFGLFFFRRLYKRPDHPVSHPFGMILVMGSDLIPCTDTAKQQLPGGISPTDHPLRASWTR
jgi:hypothetical protein